MNKKDVLLISLFALGISMVANGFSQQGKDEFNPIKQQTDNGFDLARKAKESGDMVLRSSAQAQLNEARTKMNE